MRKAAIIYNPAARHTPSPDRLSREAAAIEGWEIDLHPTEGPLHGMELSREAALAGAEVVFACGGDGTVNEVVNGLMGTPATLALIRAGTGNVFAKEVRVSRYVGRALRVLLEGEDYLFDVGIAGGRGFVLMAGIGFDGSVVRRVPSGPKRLLGTTSYLLWGAAEALRFQPRVVQLRVDSEPYDVDLYWLLLGNTRSYGGVVNVSHQAIADDGLLDTYIFAGKGLPWMLTTGARIAAGRHDNAAGVTFRRTSTVEILTEGLDVQADGEYFGSTPMSFSVATRSLRVRLPLGRSHSMLLGAPVPALHQLANQD